MVIFDPTSVNLVGDSRIALKGKVLDVSKGLRPDGSIPPSGVNIRVNMLVIWKLL